MLITVPSFPLPIRCAVISISNDVTMAFNCNLKGRYVNIFLPGEGRILQLCEVKVYATALVSGGKATLGHPWLLISSTVFIKLVDFVCHYTPMLNKTTESRSPRRNGSNE